MFTFRYHVASLAAVFLALAVGIVLGVAISGRVSKAEKTFRQDEIARLQHELDAARAKSAAERQNGFAATQLLDNAYPALMTGLLKSKRFALVFLGPANGDLQSAVERTLEDADAAAPPHMIALDVPVDPKSLDGYLRARPSLAAYAAGGANFGDLGQELGSELIAGQTTVWSQVSTKLVQERSGGGTSQLDGAIVVSTWQPPTSSTGQEGEQTKATRTLLDGVVVGLRDAGVPVIGVETLGTRPSTVDGYRSDGVSTVDDLDILPGRLALALLLAGGDPGHYGLKKSASDGVAPPIGPVFASASAP
jgi:hypothetical protein